LHSVIRPRRLFASGGSRLSSNAAKLWYALGKALASEDGLVVITGGLAERVDSPGARPADRAIIEGFMEGLRARGIVARERIETFLPDPELDWNVLRRFELGRVQVLTNRTAQSRRFRMVQSADVVISIEGETGTRSVLDVALAIERAILPLPFGSGVSANVWHEERAEILNSFEMSERDALAWERVRLAELNEDEITALAERVRAHLLRGFTRMCFVIMPFGSDLDPVYERAICPALKAHSLQPVRTDKHVPAGNVIAAIRNGLRHCFCAIADTTGDRPNVMYELGIAHAQDKPVIMLRRSDPDGEPSIPPFDVQGESILSYSEDMNDLRRRLEAAIAGVRGTTPTSRPAEHHT
jgi:predicted Rossmann-fold nucleotide-binding protein